MCTGVCWNIRCAVCKTIILKDTHVSGHNCREARRNAKRGCCKTGVEFTCYDRVSNEQCLLCEIKSDIEALDAESCDPGMSETRVGYHHDKEEDDDYEYEDEYESESSEDLWDYKVDSDDEEDDDDDDDDDDEEGGASLTDDSENSCPEVSS
ncbi:hypothetical protein F5Y05DRAFT_143244 [Hypoxylon sp. FL0543]|nr:hypothetical protein F5Y05DRAFT_143244 [Hypoxylon sp. FL0543]